MTTDSQPWKPQHWPGFTDLTIFVILVGNSAFWTKAISNNADLGKSGIPFGATLILYTLAINGLNRIQKKRATQFPDHSPLAFVRDVAVLTFIAGVSIVGSMFFFDDPRARQASLAGILIGFAFLCIVTRAWGELCGSNKSKLWGILFMLSGLFSWFLAYQQVPAMLTFVKTLEKTGLGSGQAILSFGFFMTIVGNIVLGISAVLGGLSLFEEGEKRTTLQNRLIQTMQIGWPAVGVGMVALSIGLFMTTSNLKQAFGHLLSHGDTANGLLYLMAGFLLRKHLKEQKNSETDRSSTSSSS